MGNLMHLRRHWLWMVGLALAVLGCAAASFVQSSNGIEVRDIRFPGQDGTMMSALLYVPENATEATPAAGILAVHGYYNSRETQDAFAIEFARRGYVVLALDQTGHGYSGGETFGNGFGGPDGLRYLRSLPYVDAARIGLEGHSMGGWTVATAAAAMPDGYRSLVLVGSSLGKPFAPEGTATFPRNLALIEGKYDEVAETMWGAEDAFSLGDAPKLMAAFGTDSPVQPGRIYGSIAEGTGRVYYAPPVTHAGAHFDAPSVGLAADWFDRTLGNRAAVRGQIWVWKEIATLAALIGFALFVAGAFEQWLRAPVFARLRATGEEPASELRTPRAWMAIAIVAGAVLYLPLIMLAGAIPNAGPFTQSFTTAIAVWGIVQSALLYGLMRWWVKRPLVERSDTLRSLALAAVTAVCAYALVAATAWLFTVDYRFWILGLKPLDARRLGLFLVYLPFYLLLFVLLLGTLQPALAKGGSAVRQYGQAILALIGGISLFLALQYGALFATGELLIPASGLHTILAIQFVPVLGACAALAVFAYRRTHRMLPGAFLCAMLVAWYVTAGQAIQGVGAPGA